MLDLAPVKKSRGIPVLQSVQGISLSSAAAEIIISNAQAVSEGIVEQSEGIEPVYRGSTLVCVDLDKQCFDLQTDENTLNLLLEAAKRALPLRIRLVRLARMEAERRVAPFFVREMHAETAFRIVDKQLLVDIDIECSLAVAMGESNDAEAGGK
jgi:hypothetical protein